MSAIPTVSSFASDLVVTLWTPIFVVIFFVVVAYSLWPRNKSTFDAAAKMPLREE